MGIEKMIGKGTLLDMRMIVLLCLADTELRDKLDEEGYDNLNSTVL